MSKRLTLKQLKFIQIYIETGNATKAAMEAYSCKNESVAKSVVTCPHERVYLLS